MTKNMTIARTPARRALLERINAIAARQEEEGGDIPYLEACRLEEEKWRLAHELLSQSPFATREHLGRSDQWRAAYDRVRAIRDGEFHAWILLQIEVAANIERGVREMRPRKSGPCYPQILEYLRQRHAKAEKILVFATEGQQQGGVNAVDGGWHDTTLKILKKAGRRYDPYDHAGHEEVPWPVKPRRGE